MERTISKLVCALSQSIMLFTIPILILFLGSCSNNDENMPQASFEYTITGGVSKTIKGMDAEFFTDGGKFYLIFNENTDHLAITVYTTPIDEKSYLMQSEGNANAQTGSIFTGDFHSFITDFQTGGSVSLSSVEENVITGSFNLLMDDNSPTALIVVNVSGTFTAIKRPS
jgi:hypothetical protein